jgi:hypothetical protein
MHYMILMSKKMMSQKKLGEIKSGPYKKTLSLLNSSEIGLCELTMMAILQ